MNQSHLIVKSQSWILYPLQKFGHLFNLKRRSVIYRYRVFYNFNYAIRPIPYSILTFRPFESCCWYWLQHYVHQCFWSDQGNIYLHKLTLTYDPVTNTPIIESIFKIFGFSDINIQWKSDSTRTFLLIRFLLRGSLFSFSFNIFFSA